MNLIRTKRNSCVREISKPFYRVTSNSNVIHIFANCFYEIHFNIILTAPLNYLNSFYFVAMFHLNASLKEIRKITTKCGTVGIWKEAVATFQNSEWEN